MGNHLRLHLVSDGRGSLERIQSILSETALKDIDTIQLREPDLDGRTFFHWMEILSQIPDIPELMIHDRADVFLAFRMRYPACKCGIHLGFRSIPWKLIRPLTGDGSTVSIAVHNEEEVFSAVEAGADRLIFGHIFESSSKAGLPGKGLDSLRNICGQSPVPVIAIGGIQPDHLPDIRKTGASGYAILSPFWQATNRSALLDDYRRAESIKIEE